MAFKKTLNHTWNTLWGFGVENDTKAIIGAVQFIMNIFFYTSCYLQVARQMLWDHEEVNLKLVPGERLCLWSGPWGRRGAVAPRRSLPVAAAAALCAGGSETSGGKHIYSSNVLKYMVNVYTFWGTFSVYFCSTTVQKQIFDISSYYSDLV